MTFKNRNFIIFSVDELNKINFDQVLETSADTVRRSVDGTKTFVKWDNEAPSCIDDIITKEGPYTHSEILEILSGEEWTPPNADIM